MGLGKSYGKIIISGEHAVIYKKPAVALPLKVAQTVVEISNNDDKYLEIFSMYGRSTDLNRIVEHEGLFKIIEEFKKIYSISDKLLININSEIPSKGGLGSSAAVSKALVFALVDHFNLKLNNKELFKLIQEGEKVFHVNPSGIDAKTVLIEKPIYFKKKKIKEIKVNFDGFIIVADTGSESLTVEALSVVNEFKKNNENKFNKILKAFKKISKEVKKALENNDFNLLKSSMINNQLLLEEIGVSDFSLEKLIKIANSNGASAAKLTGGGMGGSMFALSKNKAIAINIEKALIDAGVKTTYIMDLGDFK